MRITAFLAFAVSLSLATDACRQYTEQLSCDANTTCTWCKCAAVPSSCNTRVDAKRLPPAVFACDNTTVPPTPAPKTTSPKWRAFMEWKQYHHIIAIDNDEDVDMFNNFKKSLHEVNVHNSQHPPPSYQKGLTHLAGKAPTYGYKYQKPSLLSALTPPVTATAAPASVDWRDHGAVSVVKNQGDGSTCWSFSTAGAIEGASVIYNKNPLISLSNQYLINCIHKGQDTCSTDSDTMTQAFDFLKGAGGGMFTYDSYPYVDGKCVFWDPSHGCHTNASHVAAPNLNITGYVHTTVGDEESLKQAAALGPVTVAIDANGLTLYTGGVFDGQCGNKAADLNHAVLVVGYGTVLGKDYWIVKNSWGATWGEKGFFRLARGTNKCGVAVDASYPVLANATHPASVSYPLLG